MKKNSAIPGFFKLSKEKKQEIIKNFAGLTEEDIKIIQKDFLDKEFPNLISENVIGSFALPYSVANNFLINGKDYFVPMVTEEPSVVAAASYGAKLTRDGGGIKANLLNNLMIGQIYFTNLKEVESFKKQILNKKEEIIEFANRQDVILKKLGGGVKDLEIQSFEGSEIGDSLRLHLLVDVKDAMGANIVSLMSERVASFIQKLTNQEAILKIVSNLADKRLVKVEALITKRSLEKNNQNADEIIDKIVKINSIAEEDVYRTITHNKGILNGMGAVALATGNDWRALEAAVHGYAFYKKGKPLTKWTKKKKGLLGEMIVPVPVGTIGGAISAHPLAGISLKILGIDSAKELAQIIAAVGLAQNLAALRALVAEGISQSHKKVLARNVALSANIDKDKIEKVAKKMVQKNKISKEEAQRINDQKTN